MPKTFTIFGLLYCIILALLVTNSGQLPSSGEPTTNTKQSTDKCAQLEQECDAAYLAAYPAVFNYELNNEQIDKMCSKLNIADACFAKYSNSCTVPSDYYYQDSSADCRMGLVMQMCHNETYKQDYHTAKACQNEIQSEYAQCKVSSENHTTALTEQIKQIFLNLQNQICDTSTNPCISKNVLENCCTLYKYQSCTGKRSLEKCGQHSTQFANYSFEIYNRADLRTCGMYSRDLVSICM